MRSLVYFSFLFFLSFGFFSCNGDDQFDTMPCADSLEIGEFFMLDSSKDFLPYPDEDFAIIFSDSLGNEFRGEYFSRPYQLCTSISSYRSNPNDPNSEECEFTSQLECLSTVILFEALDSLEIHFMMNVVARIEAGVEEPLLNDFFTLLLYETGLEPTLGLLQFDNGQLSVNINNRNEDTPINPIGLPSTYFLSESFDIHDKTFTNVYYPNYNVFFPPRVVFDLYYSEEIGLVGFENEDKSISLKFERFE